MCNQVTCVYLLSPPSAVIWNTYDENYDDSNDDDDDDGDEMMLMLIMILHK